MSWTSAPLDSLLDVDKLIDVWRAKGMVVHKVRAPARDCALLACPANARRHLRRCMHPPWPLHATQRTCLYDCIYDCDVTVLFEAWHSKEALQAAPHIEMPELPPSWTEQSGSELRRTAGGRQRPGGAPPSGRLRFAEDDFVIAAGEEARDSCRSILNVAEGAQTPALLPFPDLTAPEVAYPAFAQPGVDPATIAHMSGVYLENLDMPELIEKVRTAANLALPTSPCARRLAKHACLSRSPGGFLHVCPTPSVGKLLLCVCAMLLAHTSLRATWLRWIRRTFRSAEGSAADSAIEQSAVGRGAQARRAVMDTAGALLRADPERSLQQIVLDLPCTFFMLRSLRSASPAWMPGRPSARPSQLAVHLRTWLCCR